jgi:hypothetical protein
VLYSSDFAASIQPWTVFSDRPATFPCRVSIISLRLAALRGRSSLIESTPMPFEHRCVLGADALELGEVDLDSHDVSP